MKKILFYSYMPMNYVMFRPIYFQLLKLNDLDIFFSGTYLKNKAVDPAELYKPFSEIDSDHIISTEEALNTEFEMLIMADYWFFNKHFLAKFKHRIKIDHGITSSSYGINAHITQFNHFFYNDQFQEEFIKQKFGFFIHSKKFRGYRVGLPKLDKAYNSTHKTKLNFDINNELPVILLLSTWNNHSLANVNNLEFLYKLAENYNIIIAIHNKYYIKEENSKNWHAIISKLASHPNIYQYDGFDIVELFKISDCIIGDIGSSVLEYLSTGNAIIRYSSELLEKNILAPIKMIYKLATDEIITQDNFDNIKQIVQSALQHNNPSIKKQICDTLFFNQGNATEVAVSNILNILHSSS